MSGREEAQQSDKLIEGMPHTSQRSVVLRGVVATNPALRVVDLFLPYDLAEKFLIASNSFQVPRFPMFIPINFVLGS